MEAEAQCAVLQELGLVDGVVTDDCDAFLFGATTVYKNIFQSSKYVEAYRTQDIKAELSFDRYAKCSGRSVLLSRLVTPALVIDSRCHG